MNIFILDQDPIQAARYQIDKHVNKMILETAQLLCSPYEPGAAPYKRTHYNHPCAIWTRESRQNYLWLIEHGYAIADEYGRRYDRTHKSLEIIKWAAEAHRDLSFPQQCLTPFAQAMPDEYKNPDPVIAYRTYYRKAKAHLATWKSPATPPYWWIEDSDGHSNPQPGDLALPAPVRSNA